MTRYVSQSDKRIRRWALQVNEHTIFEDEEDTAEKLAN